MIMNLELHRFVFSISGYNTESLTGYKLFSYQFQDNEILVAEEVYHFYGRKQTLRATVT